MRVVRACEAIDKGCCLELYYDDHSLIVEVHAIGFDAEGRAWLVAFERFGGGDPGPGAWTFLPLDETKRVAISGYFSAAPRAGYCRDDPRFDRIVKQV
jgi:hypothetical protein